MGSVWQAAEGGLAWPCPRPTPREWNGMSWGGAGVVSLGQQEDAETRERGEDPKKG